MILVIVEQDLEVVVYVNEKVVEQIKWASDEPDNDEEDGLTQVGLSLQYVVDDAQVDERHKQRLIKNHLRDEEANIFEPEDNFAESVAETKHHVCLEDGENQEAG